MLSPLAGASVGAEVYFMSKGGFFVYQGTVSRVPCTVLDYVFSNLNESQLFKVFATSDPNNNEITWFYPTGTGDTDVSNYVTFNYIENHWSIGTFARGAWIQAQTKTNPVASSNDTDNPKTQYLYTQEYGYDGDGSDIAPYIESGEVSIADGHSMAFMRRFLPDFRISGTANSAMLSVKIKGSATHRRIGNRLWLVNGRFSL